MCVFQVCMQMPRKAKRGSWTLGAGVTAISELPNMGAGTWTPAFTIQQQETQQRSHLLRTQATIEDVSHLSTVTLTARLQVSLPKTKSPKTAMWGHGKQRQSVRSTKAVPKCDKPQWRGIGIPLKLCWCSIIGTSFFKERVLGTNLVQTFRDFTAHRRALRSDDRCF